MAFVRIGQVATQLTNLTIINENVKDNPENNQDGVEDTFKTIFKAGNLQVFLNGQKLTLGIDYTDVGPDKRTFTLTDPPLVDDEVTMNYIRLA